MNKRFRSSFTMASATMALAAALMLTGCSGGSESDKDLREINYAKVYNPDGTLLVEGKYESCYYGNQVVTIKINGVKYQTAYVNVVTMWWYE